MTGSVFVMRFRIFWVSELKHTLKNKVQVLRKNSQADKAIYIYREREREKEEDGTMCDLIGMMKLVGTRAKSSRKCGHG